MQKEKAAAILGKLGGRARSRKLTKAQKSDSASYAANSRWAAQREHLIRIGQEWQASFADGMRIERQAPLRIEGRIKIVGYREGDELLSLEELATRLKISKTTAYGLTRHRAKVRSGNPIPFIKLGKELRFNWSAVCQWLTELEKGGAL